MVETAGAGKSAYVPSHGNGSVRGPSGTVNSSARRLVPLVGGAFAGGFILAKIVDWRGHAHPRG